ncbi:hypothetical protein [Mesorhizobium sp. WSM2239]|uniref:Uncharacterized protein n=2 Tax=unclassified Mesorhizobium TaxID=325217 RepID=A0AAU8D3W9_9HYPH
MGISPEAQGILADFLFDLESRKAYFSHIKTLVMATHSTIFLDRRRINNNYVVSKNGDLIDIDSVATQQEFNRIHFFLLGNRFETLYLPSIIVVVEGKCEDIFIRRALELEFPDTMFSVVHAGDDSRVKQMIYVASSFFADLQKSPYRDRIFPVLDSVHSRGLVEEIKRMGIPRENIVVWSMNGIEHYYPTSIIDGIYGAGGALKITDDVVERNGISYKKADLAEKVASRLTKGVSYPDEFKARFLDKIRDAVGA